MNRQEEKEEKVYKMIERYGLSEYGFSSEEQEEIEEIVEKFYYANPYEEEKHLNKLNSVLKKISGKAEEREEIDEIREQVKKQGDEAQELTEKRF